MKSPFKKWSLRSRLVLGVVLLTATGFVLTSLVAQSALKNYLLSQVDTELTNLSGYTLPRVVQSGIQSDSDDEDDYREHRENHGAKPLLPNTPLSRIPTSTSITVVNADGVVTAHLGGDLNTASISATLSGFTPAQANASAGEPFTIEGAGESFRAIAQILPDDAGTVVAARSLSELDKTIDRLRFFFLLIGILFLTLIAIASRIVIKIGMRPLEAVENTAEEIASGNLSARMPESEPHTEVGRLVNSLNTMLSRIETSFDARVESENKLRRFVADASHELRTPITAIRGFSELYRQGAIKGEEPTRELIGRIEGESMRMGSLVEDLLLLARMDQARQMESKPVELVHLVDDAVTSARVAGPNHVVTFTKPTEEIFTLGDEARIHQVVANVLANARAHTPAGTKIEVSISQDAGGVRLTVADNGPGMSEEHQKKIFERFYRADPSRVRVDGEGSGLGLSIVDAVMRAHGGSVSVVSEPGHGAAFTLFFPHQNN
jgi:two-component system OmpR family sensor kinase